MNSPDRPPKSPIADDKEKSSPSQGDTRASHQREPSPRLPHERDESSDSQAKSNPSQQVVGEQALDDLERGLVDTGRKPELDRVYDETLRGRDTVPDAESGKQAPRDDS